MHPVLPSPLPRPALARLARLAAVAVAALAPFAGAQPLRVEAPDDRAVAPGGFATLVFVVPAGPAGIEGRARLRLEPAPPGATAWEPLRPPGALRAEPGGRALVATTLRVPADAPAGSDLVATLEALGRDGVRVEGSVRLVVEPLRAVALDAPARARIDDGIEVRVRNAGNVPEAVRLRAVQGGAALVETELRLEPGAEVAVEVPAALPGPVALVVLRGDDEIARRVLEAVGYGPPPPPPFVLRGTARATLGSSGGSASVEVDGPLSDDLRIDAALGVGLAPSGGGGVAPDLEAGRLRVEAPGVVATLGDRARLETPAALPLPSDAGAAVRVDLPPGRADGAAAGAEGGAGSGAESGVEERTGRVSLAAAVARPDGRWSAVVAAGRDGAARDASIALGVRAGRPLLAAAAQAAEGELELEAEALLRDGAVSGEVALLREGGDGTRRFGVAFDALGRPGGAVEASFRLRSGLRSLEASLLAPAGADGSWDWSVGAAGRVRVPGATDATLRALAGLGRAGVELDAAWALGAGGSVRARAGVEVDAEGAGPRLELRAGGEVAGGVRLDAGGLAAWRSGVGWTAAELSGRLDARGGPFDLAASAAWSPLEPGVELALGAAYAGGPWRATLEVAAEPGGGGATTARLAVARSFEARVPEPLVEATGGRRLALVRGVVLEADGTPVPGAELDAGPWRLRTDAEGRFEARVEPGPLPLRLDLATVPATLRPLGPVERALAPAARGTVEAEFRLERAASLELRVLRDDDGDGVPDEPPAPLEAAFLVRDAEGRLRTARTGPDGVARVRGLPSGTTTATLSGLAAGVVATAGEERVLRAAPGAALVATFAARPPEAGATSFSAGGPRVRSAAAEADRVPPGVAPRIVARVAGAPEEVVLIAPPRRLPMEPGPEEGEWSVRLPLPDGLGAGLIPFEVRAIAGERVASRSGRVVVDPEAPAVEVTADAPVRPGETLRVDVRVLDAATAVRVELLLPDGRPPLRAAAVEIAPGLWRAGLTVPAGAPDAVAGVRVRVERDARPPLEAEGRARVLAP